MALLFDQPSPIPLHALAALAAMLLGAVQLSMHKGGRLHKLMGRIWVGLMVVVSCSSFFIYELKVWGHYSPIHLLSVWTIISCGLAIHFARKGQIKWHRYTMISLYGFALILTGLFTLLPGRVMNQIIFG